MRLFRLTQLSPAGTGEHITRESWARSVEAAEHGWRSYLGYNAKFVKAEDITPASN